MRRSCSSRSAAPPRRGTRGAGGRARRRPTRSAAPRRTSPREPEARAEEHVVDEPHAVVPVLGHAARGPHDEAQEHVGEAPRDAPRIERRERRHDVLGRAERVVLVAVLDVRDAADVEEPGRELDARGHVAGAARRPRRAAPTSERAEVVLHGVPVELDVVVAVHDRERVARGDERRERLEDAAVARDAARSFTRAWSDGVAEAVLALFVARLGGELARRRGRRAMPMKSMKSPAMTRRQRAARAGALARSARAGSRGRASTRSDRRTPVGQLVEIAPQMDIREDEQALALAGGLHT